MPGVALEVFVQSQNLPLPSLRGRTKEEVYPGAANAGRPTEVVDARRFFVVLTHQCCIIKNPQILQNLLILLLIPNARQHFLTHGSDDLSSTISDELAQSLPVSDLFS